MCGVNWLFTVALVLVPERSWSCDLGVGVGS